MSGHLFVETARPKVNLTLRVLGRRPDGYHALESLVAFAEGPGDRIVLDCGQPSGIVVSGPFEGGIAAPNLCGVVMELVAAAAKGHPLRLGRVHLEKNLPVAAGIGGGSADAGALLRALQRANPGLTEIVNWQAIAVRLGADVPVCLFDRSAWMTGIGERLQPLPGLPVLPALLVNPMAEVPTDKTAQVFRALAAPSLAVSAGANSAPPNVSNVETLAALIDGGNDLESAACSVVPAIGDVLEFLRRLPGARVAAMSGAGPTCFAVFADRAGTIRAADHLKQCRTSWWAAAAVLR